MINKCLIEVILILNGHKLITESTKMLHTHKDRSTRNASKKLTIFGWRSSFMTSISVMMSSFLG